MGTGKPHDCLQIRFLIKQNGETDHDEPTSLVNGAKSEEKKEVCFWYFGFESSNFGCGRGIFIFASTLSCFATPCFWGRERSTGKEKRLVARAGTQPFLEKLMELSARHSAEKREKKIPVRSWWSEWARKAPNGRVHVRVVYVLFLWIKSPWKELETDKKIEWVGKLSMNVQIRILWENIPWLVIRHAIRVVTTEKKVKISN